MNVCLVSYDFPPTVIGGTGTYADLLYKGLIKKGHKVKVITHGEIDSNENIIRLPTPDIKYWRNLFFAHQVGDKLKNLTKKENFDLIHYNEPYIILSQPDVPTVSTFHSIQINQLFTNISLSKYIAPITLLDTIVKSPIGSISEFLASRKSDKIICPNKHQKHMINKYCFYDNNSITVINNGVPLVTNGNDLNETVIDELVLQKEKYILFVGRLDPIKGIEYLIHAFLKLRLSHEIKLLIVGTGFYEDYLTKITNHKDIIYLGFISDRTILSNLYKNSLMLVLPSLYEAIPMVLLEAMSHGKPVISTRVGGIPEIVVNGKNGYLVEPRNIDKLYSKIKKLIENEDLRNKIGEYNKKHIEQKLTMDIMIEKTVDVYKELLNSN